MINGALRGVAFAAIASLVTSCSSDRGSGSGGNGQGIWRSQVKNW